MADLCCVNHHSYSGKCRKELNSENTIFIHASLHCSYNLCHMFSSCWQFGFMFIALIWKFDFAPFMVLIIAILNDGKIILA